MNEHTKTCQEFVKHYLGRAWSGTDGLAEKHVKKAELRLGIGLPLQAKSHFVQAGLGFVVHARGTLLVVFKVDGAQRLGVRLRLFGRLQNRQAGVRRGR